MSAPGTLDPVALSAAGPELREWMNPAIWCGWCAYTLICCKCGGDR